MNNLVDVSGLWIRPNEYIRLTAAENPVPHNIKMTEDSILLLVTLILELSQRIKQ